MSQILKKTRTFFQLESASGILLLGAALLALIAVNSPLRAAYDGLFATRMGVTLGIHAFQPSLHAWINDGLMAIFFLLVSLEIKREMLQGHLARWRQAVLPLAAAIGGVLTPALIYCAFNAHDTQALRGWAIPSATDIAFSLGVLALLGSRVPPSLKIFLTALAVIDDLAAILIIAIFYTAQLHIPALIVAGGAFAALLVLNRCGVRVLWPYLCLGVVLWAAMLASGIHATIGGVLLGLCIPARNPNADGWGSPLERLEDKLHPWVAFGIMPLFALANAGLPLLGMHGSDLAAQVPLGVAAGLVLGKPIGIFGVAASCILLRLAPMPEGASWRALLATAMLAGIGFTMSLFIAGLAFSGTMEEQARLGILLGSGVSAGLGYAMFRWVRLL